MKYILTFLLVFIGSNVKMSNVMPYTETGHSQFSEIIFEDDDGFLINNLDAKYLKKEMKKLKTKLLGTREKIFNKYEKCKYVSTVIFSRSNKTREAYTFLYDTSTVDYKSFSVTVSGNLDIKGVFKFNRKELTVSGGLDISEETEEYHKTTENGRLSVVVYPNKKVTLRIVGEARVSNGIQKKFILGICYKKGAWEVINVTSTCYELLEEDA